MTMYREKSRVFDAFPWLGDKPRAMARPWVAEAVGTGVLRFIPAPSLLPDFYEMRLQTLLGVIVVPLGSYILPSAEEGKIHYCRPDLFEVIYEEVPAPEEAPDEELVELLADMVSRHCKAEEGLDSMASSTNADAMRALAKRGLLEIEYDVGRRVIGHWTERDDDKEEA